MILRPSAQRVNLRRSFFAHVDAQLGGSFPNAIDYGVPSFAEAGLAEWIRPYLVAPATLAVGRYVTATDRAQQLAYYPQVNVFVRPRGVDGAASANADRLEILRDLVAATLKDGVVIPVLDYVGDQSAVGGLIVRGTSVDQEIVGAAGQAPEDLRQWSYGVTAHWIETYQP